VKSRIVSFRAGQWQKPIAIPVWPDAIAEDDETVTVSLSEPSAGLAVGRGEGLVTIRNDD
jgi:hypothetical protein